MNLAELAFAIWSITLRIIWVGLDCLLIYQLFISDPDQFVT